MSPITYRGLGVETEWIVKLKQTLDHSFEADIDYVMVVHVYDVCMYLLVSSHRHRWTDFPSRLEGRTWREECIGCSSERREREGERGRRVEERGRREGGRGEGEGRRVGEKGRREGREGRREGRRVGEKGRREEGAREGAIRPGRQLM